MVGSEVEVEYTGIECSWIRHSATFFPHDLTYIDLHSKLNGISQIPRFTKGRLNM